MELVWDEIGSRLYETGNKKGVLYPGYDKEKKAYGTGVAWNGLTAVTEKPSGADANEIYADDIKYAELRGAEKFGATIEAYTYPDEWAECDGSATVVAGVNFGQQKRKTFGFSFVSTEGNDTELDDYGYKLHLIYGATASPSERAYKTVNDSPEAISFSWEMTTTPVPVTVTDSDGKELKPVSCITIDSTKADATKLAALEAILYGSAEKEPRLPLPDEVYTLLGGTTKTTSGNDAGKS